MGIKELIKRNISTVSTSIEPIKFVLLLENFLSIYRNLGYHNQRGRALIFLRMILDIGYTLSCIVTYAIMVIPFTKTINIIYFYMNGANSIIIMLLAAFNSKKFKRLLTLIEDNHIFFANDKEYHRNILKRASVIKYGFLCSNIIAIVAYILMYMVLYSIKVHILFVLNARLCDYRCICEHIVIYAILYVLSAQVDCITRAVCTKKVSAASITEDNETRLQATDFEKMFIVFSNIKECSELFNKIFGLQLVLMLSSATAYCILFLYHMAFLSVKGFHDILGLIGSVLKLLTFFLPLLLVSWSAQQKLNNVNNLRRQLGKILIDCEMISDDATYKATKGFLHLVSTRSIRTKTVGSIDVDMTLIPSFIMFVTSYTVIALQFNNIV